MQPQSEAFGNAERAAVPADKPPNEANCQDVTYLVLVCFNFVFDIILPWPSDLGTWQLVDAFPNASE